MQTEGRRLEREAAGAADRLSVRLRVLDEARPSVRLTVDARALGPGGRAVGDLASADVEALALNVVVEAGASAHDDLKAIMQDVRSTAAAKTRVLDYLGASATARPAIGPATAGAVPRAIGTTDLDTVLAILLTVFGIDIGHEVDSLTAALDPAGELSTELGLRLQMALDRQSKMLAMLSNLMKKLADTSQGLIQNLK